MKKKMILLLLAVLVFFLLLCKSRNTRSFFFSLRVATLLFFIYYDSIMLCVCAFNIFFFLHLHLFIQRNLTWALVPILLVYYDFFLNLVIESKSTWMEIERSKKKHCWFWSTRALQLFCNMFCRHRHWLKNLIKVYFKCIKREAAAAAKKLIGFLLGLHRLRATTKIHRVAYSNNWLSFIQSRLTLLHFLSHQTFFVWLAGFANIYIGGRVFALWLLKEWTRV